MTIDDRSVRDSERKAAICHFDTDQVSFVQDFGRRGEILVCSSIPELGMWGHALPGKF